MKGLFIAFRYKFYPLGVDIHIFSSEVLIPLVISTTSESIKDNI